jgi:hypothetical protein
VEWKAIDWFGLAQDRILDVGCCEFSNKSSDFLASQEGSCLIELVQLQWFSGSHSNDYQAYKHLGCNAMSFKEIPMSVRNIMWHIHSKQKL